jgi:AbiV family abortive infection protein
MIKNEKIKDGAILAKEHSEYFLKQSEKLHNDKEFQAAIPLAILSFEEASKVDHLIDFINGKKDIEKDDWKELRDHKFKLTKNEKDVKEGLENQSDLDFGAQSLIMQSIGLNAISSRDVAIEVKKKEIEVNARFSKIKEMCFYANWNSNKNNWDNFKNIPLKEQEALSYFLIWSSKRKLLLAKLKIEYHLDNPFTKPFPTHLGEISQYIIDKTNHSKNLKTTQEMQEFDKEYEGEKNIEILQLGYETLCKYF